MISGVHLWLVFLKAFHAVDKYSSRSLDGTGLGDSDFRVLEVLLHKGGLPVNTIGPKVHLTPGSISVAVDRLVTKNLVLRTESKTDGRVRIVDLTAEGRALIKSVFQHHERAMEELAKVLTQAERAQLTELLKKLGKHAQASIA